MKLGGHCEKYYWCRIRSTRSYGRLGTGINVAGYNHPDELGFQPPLTAVSKIMMEQGVWLRRDGGAVDTTPAVTSSLSETTNPTL
jgi:hypothetical protein